MANTYLVRRDTFCSRDCVEDHYQGEDPPKVTVLTQIGFNAEIYTAPDGAVMSGYGALCDECGGVLPAYEEAERAGLL